MIIISNHAHTLLSCAKKHGGKLTVIEIDSVLISELAKELSSNLNNDHEPYFHLLKKLVQQGLFRGPKRTDNGNDVYFLTEPGEEALAD